MATLGDYDLRSSSNWDYSISKRHTHTHRMKLISIEKLLWVNIDDASNKMDKSNTRPQFTFEYINIFTITWALQPWTTTWYHRRRRRRRRIAFGNHTQRQHTRSMLVHYLIKDFIRLSRCHFSLTLTFNSLYSYMNIFDYISMYIVISLLTLFPHRQWNHVHTLLQKMHGISTRTNATWRTWHKNETKHGRDFDMRRGGRRVWVGGIRQMQTRRENRRINHFRSSSVCCDNMDFIHIYWFCILPAFLPLLAWEKYREEGR